MEDVSLELHEAEIIKRSSRDNRSHENQKKENKIFVAFKIDSVPERRPFLLSRDFVFARPSGEQRDPFKVSFLNYYLDMCRAHELNNKTVKRTSPEHC